ncbi:MAG TPA: enoyl-CoA hydratase/isomerase family protein, partial [Candidatus Polarisedimenticolia bacterium]
MMSDKSMGMEGKMVGATVEAAARAARADARAEGAVRSSFERGVATLTLARSAARNALTIGMIEALHAALDRIEADPTIRLVILRGEGDHFCAGADVKAFLGSVESGVPEEADHFLAREYLLDLRLARLSIPLVTIADGIAMGGGLGLAFGGYIVATGRSRFAMPESRIGFLPDVGATFELKRRLGLPLARYFAWTSESFDGRQAVKWGFADAFVEAEQIEPFLASLRRAARGEAGTRMKGSAEIAFLHGRVAGGVPAFQGRWSKGNGRFHGETALQFVERHFAAPTRHDLLRSLEKAAREAEDQAERVWAAGILATLGRRSPVSIWVSDLLLGLDYETLGRDTGWLDELRAGLAEADVEVEGLAPAAGASPRALALATEFLFGSALFRFSDFAAGVRAFQEKREPEFPSAAEPLGVQRALFHERSGWALLRHASRLARDPFWVEVARQELDWIRPPREGYDGSAFPCVRWFADGALNASVEAVDRWVERGRGERTAFIWEGDRIDSDRRPLEQRSITYAGLQREVRRCAAALRALGLRRGDTIVLYMPNIIETFIAQLAAARIGVVYHPVFAGFAREELSDRLHMMAARVLLTVDGAFRKGEAIQYKRDFVDPALRDFVPVEPAMEAAERVLTQSGDGAAERLLPRLRAILSDKVTVEKGKFLEILSREMSEEATAGRDGVAREAGARDGAALDKAARDAG